MTFQIELLVVFVAYVLDLILGDPPYLPHPIVYFGRSISWFEKRFNKGGKRFLKGLLVTVILVTAVLVFFMTAQYLLSLVDELLSYLFIGLFFFYGLANRTLIKEGQMVFEKLEEEGLEAGRKQLSRIVGRDTSQLSAQQIRTAVLETMAENLSDGVVAPVFWFAIGGIPAMMAYKMVNTLDSMIGYKSERYLYYGRFAARLDDVANYIPARLTGLLMVMVTGSLRAFRFMLKFGNKHSSPNAGYPESALAGILSVQFGGSNIYHGKRVDKPHIGINNRAITMQDYSVSARVNHAVCFVAIVLALALKYALYY
ncbi:adenosylcobinamide-phosphate synthase CbiB [Carboxylicivirga sp. N1Y90]|uniref:adenosylcobinamide-phosphate synthase CbiB n=1 Tax=Carboxylicivirga fragile TaxID=3417571 RepID=UPI003D333079|nr:cobalamin biosynthesis protein CobD [Marinilabiliaceae bacterium N1Y90]